MFFLRESSRILLRSDVRTATYSIPEKKEIGIELMSHSPFFSSYCIERFHRCTSYHSSFLIRISSTRITKHEFVLFIRKLEEIRSIIRALIESIFLALFVKLQTYTHRLCTHTNARTNSYEKKKTFMYMYVTRL